MIEIASRRESVDGTKSLDTARTTHMTLTRKTTNARGLDELSVVHPVCHTSPLSLSLPFCLHFFLVSLFSCVSRPSGWSLVTYPINIDGIGQHISVAFILSLFFINRCITRPYHRRRYIIAERLSPTVCGVALGHGRPRILEEPRRVSSDLPHHT